MKKMIKITTSNEVSVLDFPVENPNNYTQKLIGFYQAINCNCIEIVRPQYMPSYINDFWNLVMIVDENGLMNKKEMNIIASLFYGTQEHGSAIVGDILIVTEEMTLEGSEIAGLEEGNAEVIAAQIKVLINYVITLWVNDN